MTDKITWGPLLPEYLNQNWNGAAVSAVIQVFRATCWDEIPPETGNLQALSEELLPDDRYGEALTNFVKELQRLAFEHGHNLEVDGHFGPDTRRALKELYGIDVDRMLGQNTDVTAYLSYEGAFKYVPGKASLVRD